VQERIQQRTGEGACWLKRNQWFSEYEKRARTNEETKREFIPKPWGGLRGKQGAGTGGGGGGGGGTTKGGTVRELSDTEKGEEPRIFKEGGVFTTKRF